MQDGALHRIVYVSTICATLKGVDLTTTLEGILAESRAWNADHQITGLLLFGHDHFGQVLEGPLGEVEYIFERIRGDPRHERVIKLDYRALDERQFSGWAMAALPYDGLAGQSNEVILKAFDLKRLPEDAALKALRRVLDEQGLQPSSA